MNLDDQRTNRVLAISSLVFILNIIFSIPCNGWHQTLTFTQKLTYETTSQMSVVTSEMKFFMWYNSYAIYGARETLLLLKPVLNTSSIEVFLYNWSIDAGTMEECRQEWNSKEKCYNDVVHVRILPNRKTMDVYCTYAHRPMVRSFDLRSMSFIDEHILIRDPHPPMDSERSYVMLTFNKSLVTAGYQGDYIPTIRATQGKTLLYALRQNSHFVSGFKYDGKAVFGVIETSERIDTNRVSRLVMACANRTEIIRKATLNCSTNIFEPSRSFVFHILTALIDPIHTANGSVLLFATFTTNNSSITASAVCLFMLDKQFYDVFTGPSIKNSRTSEMNELIFNCSQSIPSTIDRDMVESDRQFLPYLSSPLLIESMSNHIFTAISVIQYKSDLYCLIIGTSSGRLFTAFTDVTFKTNIFEELTLSMNVSYSIKSITYKKVSNNSYAIFVTNQVGYSIIKLTSCQDNDSKLCFECWMHDCSIRKTSSTDRQCSHEDHFRPNANNHTDMLTLESDSSLNNQTLDEKSKMKLLFYIVMPLSSVVFILSILIIVLLTKSNHKLKKGQFYPTACRKTQDSSSAHVSPHTYTNNVMYRTNRQFVSERKNHQHVFPIKSNLCIRRISSTPVYSTVSSQSLPSLLYDVPSDKLQDLSVHRLYKTYV
ncbi:unnamed protein product [Rotaria socialis]|uniref:Sema domain-containing protein n=1 Tax=Rotaria socialis TaxID=392032 RepID=A0A821JXS8_9BILA|nr:unnamed protein product [Rotaria socialis]CAF4727543.1 unnamed protein product [Rotaria socialis]